MKGTSDRSDILLVVFVVRDSTFLFLRVPCFQLALVHMSDHYTRITTGGSPLPKTAPVVGLLFGHANAQAAADSDNHRLSIVDAEDIPLTEPTPAVELHQAVFPKNVVMGCYRVTATESQPTAADIRQVQSLRQALESSSSNTADGGGEEKKKMHSQLFFGLLQVNPVVKDNSNNSNSKNDDESELPLQLFVLQDNSVLVAADDWNLTTAASAERIAVERVLRDKPKQEDEAKLAWLALDARLQQIMDFLQQTLASPPPPPPPANSNNTQHLELWRAIQGLLVQAHLLRTQSSSGGPTTTMLPQQVAVLTKTVDAIAWYTDKFRVVYESAASLRERRF